MKIQKKNVFLWPHQFWLDVVVYSIELGELRGGWNNNNNKEEEEEMGGGGE
jgi:hypothetical protein